VQQVAPLFDFIHHVQGHNHGPAEFFQLQGQVQVALEIAGIDDIDDDVRLIFQDIVASDDFFDRVGRQGIDAWQIDQGEQIGTPPDHAHFLFDGHAGPVASGLTRASQAVEQGGFARIRIASQSEMDIHC